MRNQIHVLARALLTPGLAVALAGCGGAAPVADKPCDGSGAPPAGFKPSRKVLIACESVEIRDDAPPDTRETVVGRPRITTLVGRPASVSIETIPAPGAAPQIFSIDLAVGEVGGALSLSGRSKLESGGTVLGTDEAPAQTPPVDRIALRFSPAPGRTHEIRCAAGDPPAAPPVASP